MHTQIEQKKRQIKRTSDNLRKKGPGIRKAQNLEGEQRAVSSTRDWKSRNSDEAMKKVGDCLGMTDQECSVRRVRTGLLPGVG